MAQDWYYSRAGGSQTGPVSMADLQRLGREGTLLPTDLLWQEGLPNWQAASTVPGVFQAPPPEPAPAPRTPSFVPPAPATERAPRGPSPFAGMMEGPKLWETLKWGSLGLGGLLMLAAFVANVFYAPMLAVAASFFAVVSRIMQAEQHHAK